MSNEFKWIVTDLDGTLIHHTNNDNIIYKDVVEEINRISKTKKFTIATGRHYKDVLAINEKFGLKIPKDSFIIGANGCQIFSVNNNELLVNQTINNLYVQSEIPKIVSYLDKTYPHSTLIFGYGENENIYFVKNNSNKFYNMMQNVKDFEENEGLFKYLINDNIAELNNITKFIIYFIDDLDNPLHIIKNLQKISIDFDYANTGSKFVEIIIKNINKAVGLEYINNNFYNINVKDILLFGDSGNDIEMMNYAGTSITRSDARKEIKSVANIVYKGGPSKFVKNALIDLIK